MSKNSLETSPEPQAEPTIKVRDALEIILPNTQVVSDSIQSSGRKSPTERLLIKLPSIRVLIIALLSLSAPLALNACGEEKEETTVNYLYDAEAGTGKIPVKLEGKTKEEKNAKKYAFKELSLITDIKISKLKKMYTASLIKVPGFTNWAIVSFVKNGGTKVQKSSKSSSKKVRGLGSSNSSLSSKRKKKELEDPLAGILSDSERDIARDIFLEEGRREASLPLSSSRSRTGRSSEPSTSSKVDPFASSGSRTINIPTINLSEKSQRKVDLKERKDRLPMNSNGIKSLMKKHKYFKFDYEVLLKRDPNLKGKMIVRVIVGKNGKVKNVSFPKRSDVTLKSRDLERKIRSKIMNAVFDEEGEFEIPLVFQGR